MTAEKKKVSEIGKIGIFREGSERILKGGLPVYSCTDIADVCADEDEAAEQTAELASEKGCAVLIPGHCCSTADQVSLFRIVYTALGLGKPGKPIVAVISSVVLPSELETVRKNASEARNGLARENRPFGKLCAGIRIETPSASILTDILAPMSDFFVFDGNAVEQSLKKCCTGERADRPMNEIVERCLRLTSAAAGREGIAVYTVS